MSFLGLSVELVPVVSAVPLGGADMDLRWSHFVGQFGSAVKVYSVV